MKPYRPPKRTLHSAAEAGDIESIMFHLLQGVDVNARKANGHFPLAGAAHYGHAQAVKYLVEHGAKINMLTAYNWSPLFIAVWRGHLDVAEVLLLAGARTTPRTISGEFSPCPGGFTALHAAAYTGNTKMVRLLLAHGADSRAKAGARVPEDVARDEGHMTIARLLRSTRRAGAWMRQGETRVRILHKSCESDGGPNHSVHRTAAGHCSSYEISDDDIGAVRRGGR